MTHPFRLALRRTVLSLCALLAAAASLVTSSRAATSNDQAVLAPVQAFFDALAHHDVAGVDAQMLPGGTATIIRRGKILHVPLTAIAKRLPPKNIVALERIYDPLVRVDHQIAMIWAPYTVTLNGKLDHCGTDVFNLIRVNGRWLIAAAADNSRTDCAAIK